MADAALRQLLMIQKIPAYPRKISPPELQSYLESQDFPADIRTIQRDLQKLLQILPLDFDDRDKPYGWFFRKDEVMSLPGMDPSTALTFVLAEIHLTEMLPPEVLASIRPYFKTARKLVEGDDHSKRGAWLNKVVRVPEGLQLQPAKTDPDVLEKISHALMNEKAIVISRSEKGEHLIHPLGLVLRGRLIYLVCLFGSSDKRYIVKLHTITAVNPSEEAYRKLPEFSLAEFVAQGGLGFREVSCPIKLKVRFYGEAVDHLYDSPMSDDQVIFKDGTGAAIVSATVLHTRDLEWWLLAFGDKVEVLEPTELRDEVRQIVAGMAARYRD